MNILVVVPARGGSKRIPYKNIAALSGKPLLLHTLDNVRQAGLGGSLVVSTEDELIAKVALASGARVIDRPPELASDTASTESVLLSVLSAIAEESGHPKWLMTLPPTSPFRSAATIKRFADLAESTSSDVDCFMSVTENRGDFWYYATDGRFQRLFPDAPRRQQDREPLFEENSAVYLSRVTTLIETGSILGRRVVGIPIAPHEGLDINTPEDLMLAEALFAARSRGI